MSSQSADASHFRRFVFPSTLSELHHVVQEAEAFAKEHTSDEDVQYRVVLLTTEAVTNAVEHGNRSDPAKTVILEFSATETQIEVCVEDEGEGFDPKGVANPLTKKNIMREGGRGIFLIDSLADAHSFENGGRRLRMVFHIPN